MVTSSVHQEDIPLTDSILLSRNFTFSDCPGVVRVFSLVGDPLLSLQPPTETGRKDSAQSSTHRPAACQALPHTPLPTWGILQVEAPTEKPAFGGLLQIRGQDAPALGKLTKTSSDRPALCLQEATCGIPSQNLLFTQHPQAALPAPICWDTVV